MQTMVRVDINWEIEEKSADQLELCRFWRWYWFNGHAGCNVSTISPLKTLQKIQPGITLPSGDGQKFSLRFQSNGRAYSSYNASFTEPWLGR